MHGDPAHEAPVGTIGAEGEVVRAVGEVGGCHQLRAIDEGGFLSF